MKGIKTIGAAALAAFLLGGCSTTQWKETFSYMGDKIADGWNLVVDSETATVGAVRKSNFAEPRKDQLTMKVEAKSLYLRGSANGTGFTEKSINDANKFLLSQGPIRRQVLTIVPLSENGRKLALRLAEALEEAGAVNPQLAHYESEDEPGKAVFPDRRMNWDIELISEAYVVNAPDCLVADADRWTIEPYAAVGTLGCANHANIAVMVSDPKDLLRPKALAPADGENAVRVVKDYQAGETEDLIDIDFDSDE